MRSLLAISLATALCAACGGSTPTSGCADPQLIDDMEDNDRFICASAGRHGDWFMRDDGTSTNISPRGEFLQSEIPGGRGGSRHAAHLTGFGFTDWGAAMGFSLNGEGASAQSYDASAASGVRFWMKSNAPIVVTFPIPETLAAGTSAACVDDVATWNCDNHFQFRITAPSSEWTEYDVPFAAAEQKFRIGPDGNTIAGSSTWNPSTLVAVQFGIEGFQTFDVWVDDVRFYSCSAAACVPTCRDPGLPVACPATNTAPASCRTAGTVCAKSITAFLPGLWGSGPSDVWAVGYGGTILHWNGAGWVVVPSGTTEFLSVVGGTGPDDVWAVGVGGTILHWNGSAWSASVSGTKLPIFGLWAGSANDVWAVGDVGTALHWDGSTWSSVPSGTSYRMVRVWGSGSNDVWATGQSPTTGSSVIIHWDGSSWSPISTTVPRGALGVGGSGPNDVWVVGEGITHWDGSAWTAVPSGVSQYFQGVWANSPTDAWAVGFEGTIIRWNGSAWSPVSAGTSIELTSVWASGPNDAWAVGDAGTTLHWDGTAWSLVPVEVQ